MMHGQKNIKLYYDRSVLTDQIHNNKLNRYTWPNHHRSMLNICSNIVICLINWCFNAAETYHFTSLIMKVNISMCISYRWNVLPPKNFLCCVCLKDYRFCMVTYSKSGQSGCLRTSWNVWGMSTVADTVTGTVHTHIASTCECFFTSVLNSAHFLILLVQAVCILPEFLHWHKKINYEDCFFFNLRSCF